MQCIEMPFASELVFIEIVWWNTFSISVHCTLHTAFHCITLSSEIDDLTSADYMNYTENGLNAMHMIIFVEFTLCTFCDGRNGSSNGCCCWLTIIFQQLNRIALWFVKIARIFGWISMFSIYFDRFIGYAHSSTHHLPTPKPKPTDCSWYSWPLHYQDFYKYTAYGKRSISLSLSLALFAHVYVLIYRTTLMCCIIDFVANWKFLPWKIQWCCKSNWLYWDGLMGPYPKIFSKQFWWSSLRGVIMCFCCYSNNKLYH